jgi:hypothetical protein
MFLPGAYRLTIENEAGAGRRFFHIRHQSFHLFLIHMIRFFNQNEPISGKHRKGLSCLDDLLNAVLLPIEEVEVKPSLFLRKSLIEEFLDFFFDEVILRTIKEIDWIDIGPNLHHLPCTLFLIIPQYVACV